MDVAGAHVPISDPTSKNQAPWRKWHPHIGLLLFGRRRAKPRLTVVAAAVWAGLALAFMWEFSIRPRSLIGWVVCLAVGPIGFLLFATLGEMVAAGFQTLPLVRGTRARVLETTSTASFSWLRIAYLLCETILFLAII